MRFLILRVRFYCWRAWSLRVQVSSSGYHVRLHCLGLLLFFSSLGYCARSCFRLELNVFSVRCVAQA